MLRARAHLSVLLLLAAGYGEPAPAETDRAASLLGKKTYDRPEVGYLEKDGEMQCTGTLIGKRVVLTAAHCFTDRYGQMFHTPPPLDRQRRISCPKAPFYRFVVERNKNDQESFLVLTWYLLARSYWAPHDIAVVLLEPHAEAFQATRPELARNFEPTEQTFTLFGYGCNDRTTEEGYQTKRSASLKVLKKLTYVTCARDSGGPVFNEKGQIAALIRGFDEYNGYDGLTPVFSLDDRDEDWNEVGDLIHMWAEELQNLPFKCEELPEI